MPKAEAVLAHSQGLPAPIVGAMAENATLFLAYSEIQSVVRDAFGVLPSQTLSLPQLGIAAAGAGARPRAAAPPRQCARLVRARTGGPHASFINTQKIRAGGKERCAAGEWSGDRSRGDRKQEFARRNEDPEYQKTDPAHPVKLSMPVGSVQSMQRKKKT